MLLSLKHEKVWEAWPGNIITLTATTYSFFKAFRNTSHSLTPPGVYRAGTKSSHLSLSVAVFSVAPQLHLVAFEFILNCPVPCYFGPPSLLFTLWDPMSFWKCCGPHSEHASDSHPPASPQYCMYFLFFRTSSVMFFPLLTLSWKLNRFI